MTRLLITLMATALSTSALNAATFTPTFDTPSFPGTQFDVETDASYNDYYRETYGIEIYNAYLYVDARDTFDGIGIANGSVALAGTSDERRYGRIDFLDTTDTVSLDYWALSPSVYAAYAADDTLIASETVPTGISTLTLNGGIISYLLFSADTSGFATVSSLTYNYDGTTDGRNDDLPPVDAVPLPAGLPMLLTGLMGLGVLTRRKPAA